jgi:hypothetical protein
MSRTDRSSSASLPWLVEIAQQGDQRLEILQAEPGATGSGQDKGVRSGQVGPVGRERPHPASSILEEDAWFAPGPPLTQEGKVLPTQGMERVGDREDDLSIRATGCS